MNKIKTLMAEHYQVVCLITTRGYITVAGTVKALNTYIFNFLTYFTPIKLKLNCFKIAHILVYDPRHNNLCKEQGIIL